MTLRGDRRELLLQTAEPIRVRRDPSHRCLPLFTIQAIGETVDREACHPRRPAHHQLVREPDDEAGFERSPTQPTERHLVRQQDRGIEEQGGDAFGVACSEVDRGRSPGREPQHGDTFELHGVEHRRVQVGLFLGSTTRGQRRPQISRSRRSEHLTASVPKMPSPREPQIEATRPAVDHQHRRPLTFPSQLHVIS